MPSTLYVALAAYRIVDLMTTQPPATVFSTVVFAVNADHTGEDRDFADI